MAKPRSVSPRKRFRILALDGGGIRGVISALWLTRLERELQRLGKGTIAANFDLIAGTSTGSILAAGLVNGVTAGRLLSMYQGFGREIFPSTAKRRWDRLSRLITDGPSAPKYSDAGLASVLQREFGTTTLGEVAEGNGRPRLLIFTYNLLVRQALVLKNDGREEFQHLPLWEAVKASCSAPTYFPAHVAALYGSQVPLVDGGVVANNPTACAVAEGLAIQRKAKRPSQRCRLDQFIVASFGTGELTRPITAAEGREWGALEWAVPIIDVLFDGASDAVDYIAKQLLEPGVNYFRFQTRLDKAYDDMDNADATNINALELIAQRHLSGEHGEENLKALAALL